MVVLKKWGQEGRLFNLRGRQFILLEKEEDHYSMASS